MTTLQQIIEGQTYPEVPQNENFDAVSAFALFAKRHAVTGGLTWGYYGGFYDSVSIADGTVTLTDDATNYVVMLRADGTVSVATATTNWDNTTDYGRLYKVTTASGLVTAEEDHRFGAKGILTSVGAAASTSAADVSIADAGSYFTGTDVEAALQELGAAGASGTAGKHAIYIAAGSVRPASAAGCAALATVAGAAGQPDLNTCDFDATTQEHAQFSIVMPKSWDEGTVTFRAHWSHPATTTNFGVVWGLQAVAVSDDDTLAVAFGTAQTSTDTGGTTDDLYTSPESSAITVAGTPAAEDMVVFRVYRDVAAGGDTLAVDARLHGITIYITTDAETDA